MIRSDRFHVNHGNAAVYRIEPGESLDGLKTGTSGALDQIDTSRGGWLVIDAGGDPVNSELLDNEEDAIDLAHWRHR